MHIIHKHFFYLFMVALNVFQDHCCKKSPCLRDVPNEPSCSCKCLCWFIFSLELKECVLCQMKCETVNLLAMMHSSCFILICFGQSETHINTHTHTNTLIEQWLRSIWVHSFSLEGNRSIQHRTYYTHTQPHIPNQLSSAWRV